MRVLLVESDLTAAKNLVGFFAAQNLRTEAADTGEDALALVRHYQFDIIVLSLSLPDLQGARVISRMRTLGVTTPVIALASDGQRPLNVDVFAAGADDVVDARVYRPELVARMHAIVRRSHGHSQSTLQAGPVTLDLGRHEATANETVVPLTRKEFEIVHLLLLRKNAVLTKEVILEQLYGGMDEPEAKIIDVFVCKIRKKFAQAGVANVVGTVRGRGYTIRDTRLEIETHRAVPHVPEPAHFAQSRLVFA